MAFAALRKPGPFDFTDKSLPREMQAARMALAEDGFVPPPLPIDVLLIQRKLAGTFLIASKLQAKIEISEFLAPHLR